MIRPLARAAARLLPAWAKAGLARRRFGDSDAGPHIPVERREEAGQFVYEIDHRVTFLATSEATVAVDYNCIQNGDSRAELASFMRVSAALAQDALLLDVGAHLGLFAIVHLKLAVGHRALLFEPSPPLSSASSEWLRLNGLTDRGEARCAGVGDTVDIRAIGIDALGFARQAGEGPAPTVDVPFTTIDHVCRTEGRRPALIKIDVEGHEAEVLRGARDTLRRDRPIVCLELHLDILEARGESLSALLADLTSAGYVFESTLGERLSAAKLRRSLKAILRIVARPAG